MSGKWKNELGSVMELMEHKNGQITGMYLTAVTSKKSDHTEETADLVGYINTDQTKQTTTIAFCMAWKIQGGFCPELSKLGPGGPLSCRI